MGVSHVFVDCLGPRRENYRASEVLKSLIRKRRKRQQPITLRTTMNKQNQSRKHH